MPEEEWSSKLNVPTEKIPESLYWKPSADDDPENLNVVTVRAGTYSLISHFVLDPGVNMKWYVFGLEEYTMGIYHSDDPKSSDIAEMEEVFPDVEYPGMPTMDSLQIPLEKPGMYHLKFGNEKAWWYSVEIRYRLEFTDEEGNPVKTIPVDPDDGM